MKAYTINVHATINEKNYEKVYSFASEADRNWFINEIGEWSANEDVHEYSMVSPGYDVEWPYDQPPREYYLESCKRYLTETPITWNLDALDFSENAEPN